MENFYLHDHQLVRTISKSEPLQANFLVRLINKGVAYESSHKPDDWDIMAWHLLENELPFWVGKTIEDYEKNPKLSFNYEVVELVETLHIHKLEEMAKIFEIMVKHISENELRKWTSENFSSFIKEQILKNQQKAGQSYKWDFYFVNRPF